MPPTPTIHGVHNFRDFGGYAAGARRVRRGVLYRSAHHAQASDDDLETLAALNLAAIVDLRRPHERRRDPSRRWRDFAATVIDNDHGDPPPGEDDPYHIMLRRPDLSVAVIHEWNLRYYREAPFEPRHIDLFARYFAALGAGKGPVLIHCAIGRDRTGILAALTQHLLGVHRDDIMHEYLLTNDNPRLAERTPDLIKFVTAQSGRPPDAATMRALTQIQPELLETAFAEIAAQCGSADAYIESALRVDARMRDAIAAAVLE
jgi:protein tyrosine/serine phosphatase